jgi:hypothetical protein
MKEANAHGDGGDRSLAKSCRSRRPSELQKAAMRLACFSGTAFPSTSADNLLMSLAVR